METKTLQERLKPEYNTSSINKNLGLYELLSFDDLPKEFGMFLDSGPKPLSDQPLIDFGTRYHSSVGIPDAPLLKNDRFYSASPIIGKNNVRFPSFTSIDLVSGPDKDINLPGYNDPCLGFSTRIDTHTGLPKDLHTNIDIKLMDRVTGKSEGFSHPLGRKGFNRFTGLFEDDDGYY